MKLYEFDQCEQRIVAEYPLGEIDPRSVPDVLKVLEVVNADCDTGYGIGDGYRWVPDSDTPGSPKLEFTVGMESPSPSPLVQSATEEKLGWATVPDSPGVLVFLRQLLNELTEKALSSESYTLLSETLRQLKREQTKPTPTSLMQRTNTEGN